MGKHRAKLIGIGFYYEANVGLLLVCSFEGGARASVDIGGTRNPSEDPHYDMLMRAAQANWIVQYEVREVGKIARGSLFLHMQ